MSRNKRINFVCPDKDNLKIQYVRIKFFKTPLNKFYQNAVESSFLKRRWIKFLKTPLNQFS